MKNKSIIYIILIALLVCAIIAGGIIFKNKGTDNVLNITGNSNVEKKQVVYYSFGDKLDFVFSSMATKVDDPSKISNKVLIKETITKETSNETMYELFDNLEFDGEHYLYGIFTKEYIDRFDMFDVTECDNKFEKDMGEGTTRICKMHEPGFTYDKIESEMLIRTSGKVINIKVNDWANAANYKKEFEDAKWKCDHKEQELRCKEPNSEFVVSLYNSGEVLGNENSGYCYLNNDLASWCITLKEEEE